MLYFDHNATTPVASEVADAYAAALRTHWGNPSSIHGAGQLARQALETSRRSVAGFLGTTAADLVLTSGGTESNNLAVLGVVRPKLRQQPLSHVITTAVEHPAVLGPCAQLEREGAQVTYLPVDSNGVVDPDDVRRAIRPATVLISVMHANNETGAIQPISTIAAVANELGVVMHSDGVQAAGKIPLHVGDLGVSLYSVSAHKFYAPRGIGALVVRKKIAIEALHFGGQQERERRAGTEDVAGAIAFAKAAERCQVFDVKLRDYFEARLRDAFPECVVNSAKAERLPNTSCVTFPGISGESLVIGLDMKGMAVSSGSACSSGSSEPSHVLLAMGRSRAEAKSTVRFSFGEGNTFDEVDRLAEAAIAIVYRLRKSAPHEVSVA